VAVLLVRRFVISLCAALLVLLGIAMPAAAATPPANDLLANATVVASTPFSDVVDTTAATTDADDAPATSFCPLPPGSRTHSVWYLYTNTTSTPRQLVVDTTGSGYDTSEAIDVGSPISPTAARCVEGDPAAVAEVVGPGATAWIVISSVSGAGGNLAVSIEAFSSPSNDTIGGATSIASLPFRDVVGTFLATTDASDDQVRASCGVPSTNHSVWYVFTAGPSNTSVLLDTTASSFNAGIIIAIGSPGALTAVACGDGIVSVPTTPGTTYYALVHAGFGACGRLDLTVSPTPPPPTFDLRFGENGTVDRLGVARLAGTYRCTTADFAALSGRAVQGKRAGTIVVDGGFTCDGDRHLFTATATAEESRPFTSGRLRAEFSLFACNKGGCIGSPSMTQVILLKPASK